MLINDKIKQFKLFNFKKNKKDNIKLKDDNIIIKGQGLSLNKKKLWVFVIIKLPKNIELI